MSAGRPDDETTYARILYGGLAWIAVWFALTFWEVGSNGLVRLGLLVSSKKPHLFTLPFQDTGVNLRTIVAVIGIGLIVGGAYGYLRYIYSHHPGEALPPPAASQVYDPSPMPQMPPMAPAPSPYGPPQGGYPPQYPPPPPGGYPPPGMYGG